VKRFSRGSEVQVTAEQVQRCKADIDVERFRGSEVQRGAEVQKCRCRNAGVQRSCRGAGAGAGDAVMFLPFLLS